MVKPFGDEGLKCSLRLPSWWGGAVCPYLRTPPPLSTVHNSSASRLALANPQLAVALHCVSKKFQPFNSL